MPTLAEIVVSPFGRDMLRRWILEELEGIRVTTPWFKPGSEGYRVNQELKQALEKELASIAAPPRERD